MKIQTFQLTVDLLEKISILHCVKAIEKCFSKLFQTQVFNHNLKKRVQVLYN